MKKKILFVFMLVLLVCVAVVPSFAFLYTPSTHEVDFFDMEYFKRKFNEVSSFENVTIEKIEGENPYYQVEFDVVSPIDSMIFLSVTVNDFSGWTSDICYYNYELSTDFTSGNGAVGMFMISRIYDETNALIIQDRSPVIYNGKGEHAVTYNMPDEFYDGTNFVEDTSRYLESLYVAFELKFEQIEHISMRIDNIALWRSHKTTGASLADVNYYKEKGADIETDEFYTQGYDEGYNFGLYVGELAGYRDGYDVGKTDGYDEGNADGYNLGFSAGEQSEVSENILDIIGEIVSAPFRAISTMFNFEIFGINIAGTIFGIITLIVALAVIIALVKFFV